MFDPLKWHNEITRIIKEYNPEIDTSIGTVIGDTIVIPLAIIREILDKVKNYVSSLYCLDDIINLLNSPEKIDEIATALDITPDEVIISLRTVLENIASDYSIVRQEETYATGIVYYIPANSYLPAGVYTVYPSDKIKSIFNVQYEPIMVQSFIVTEDNKSDFYVPKLNTYAFPVMVRCSIPGSIGNIGPEQINYDFGYYLSTNWSRAINIDPITGGKEKETDKELVERIKQKWKGVNLGTISGYKQLLYQYNIKDVYISGPGDMYMKRAIAGSIDIYIKEKLIRTTEIILPITVNANSEISIKIKDYLPEFMYVYDVKPINFDISITKINDESFIYRKSTKANDILIIKNLSSNDITNVPVLVTYNDKVANIQKILDLPENRILGLDIMVREALPIYFDIHCNINLLPGYLFSEVSKNIKNAILNYVKNLPLGSKIATSDLINIVEDVPGVDNVTLQIIYGNKIVDIVKAEPINYLEVKDIIIL